MQKIITTPRYQGVIPRAAQKNIMLTDFRMPDQNVVAQAAKNCAVSQPSIQGVITPGAIYEVVSFRSHESIVGVGPEEQGVTLQSRQIYDAFLRILTEGSGGQDFVLKRRVPVA
nr:hypothetical protein [Pelagibius marinus]